MQSQIQFSYLYTDRVANFISAGNSNKTSHRKTSSENLRDIPSEKSNPIKLTELSNEQLEFSMGRHVRAERKMLHLILEHIREIHRRDLHLVNHARMQDYLIKKFGYSEPCARHRVAAAKLMSEVPAIADKLQDGSMNLSKIVELNRAIQEKESEVKERVPSSLKVELVEMISGKTCYESQEILAKPLDIPIKETVKVRVQQNKSVRVEFTMSEAMKEKFDKVRDLLGHQLSQELKAATLENVFEAVLDLFLETRAKEFPEEKEEAALAVNREYASITPKLCQLVLQKDRVCQHKGPDGNLCGSTQFLQADHIVPELAGGTTQLSNLQALCGEHNRYKFRQQFQSGVYPIRASGISSKKMPRMEKQGCDATSN